MNKKGALFHWIVLGILLATGIFFLNISDGVTEIQVKGAWPLSFVDEFVLQAESDLLQQDTAVIEISQNVLLDIAKQPCGHFYAEWNTQCPTLNRVQETFFNNVKTDINEKYPLQFSEFRHNNNFLSAKGKFKSINKTDPFVNYTYNTGFTIDTGYDFTEFAQLISEVQDLRKDCKGRSDLDDCISTKKQFVVEACEATHNPGGKSKSFCIQTKTLLQNQPVKYLFTIDFS